MRATSHGRGGAVSGARAAGGACVGAGMLAKVDAGEGERVEHGAEEGREC